MMMENAQDEMEMELIGISVSVAALFTFLKKQPLSDRAHRYVDVLSSKLRDDIMKDRYYVKYLKEEIKSLQNEREYYLQENSDIMREIRLGEESIASQQEKIKFFELKLEINNQEKEELDEKRITTNEKHERRVQAIMKTKEDQLNEMRDLLTLRHKEDKNDLLRKHKMEISQLHSKIERLEREMAARSSSSKTIIHQLEKSIDQRNQRVTELEDFLENSERLTRLKTEENDQISYLMDWLKMTLNEMHYKKDKSRRFKTSLKQNQKSENGCHRNYQLQEEVIRNENTEYSQMCVLESKVKKDLHLRSMNDEMNHTLKKQNETESGLNVIISSIKEIRQSHEIDIKRRDIQVKNLEEELDSLRNEMNRENEHFIQKLKDINTSLQKKNQEKDNHISELRYQKEQVLKQLNDKDAEIEELEKKLKSLETEAERRERKLIQTEEMVRSQTVEISRLTNINRLVEKEKKEIDTHFREKTDQLRQEKQQNDQLNSTLKTLQENEKESDRMITSLKKNNQLEQNIERRDQEIKDLKNSLDSMRKESSGTNAHFHQQLNDKEKQLSDQRTQLQRALNQIKEQEIKMNDFKILQKKESKEKDDQISHLRAKLQENSKDLEGKMAEVKEIEISLKKEIKRLVSEVEHRQQNISRLEENLSSKRVDIDRLKNISKHLENTIQDDNAQARKQIHQLQHEIQNLQREVKRRDLKLKDLDKMLHKKIETGKKEEDKDVRDKEQKIADLKDQLRNTSVTLQDTEAELEETKTRLSKAMGDRLTDNNPNITDLSDRNRPTKLAERCAELYDNQWTDAFDILDKYFDTEEIVIDALLRILQDAMTFCIAQAHEQMRALGRELKFAGQHEREDVSADVLKHFKDSRKSVASVAIRNLYKMFVSHLKRSTDKTLRSALEVSPYTSECLEICWLMVIQDPPVAFAPVVRRGSSFNTDLYKPYTTSGTLISYVVWPPLLLHDGGPILAKGVAQGYAKKQKGSTM